MVVLFMFLAQPGFLPFLVIFLFLRNGDLLWVTERLRMFACLLALPVSVVWSGMVQNRLDCCFPAFLSSHLVDIFVSPGEGKKDDAAVFKIAFTSFSRSLTLIWLSCKVSIKTSFFFCPCPYRARQRSQIVANYNYCQGSSTMYTRGKENCRQRYTHTSQVLYHFL